MAGDWWLVIVGCASPPPCRATNSAHVHEIWIWDMRTGTGVLVVHVNTPLCCAVAACCAHGCAVWIFGLLAPLAISVWLCGFFGLGGRLFVVCSFYWVCHWLCPAREHLPTPTVGYTPSYTPPILPPCTRHTHTETPPRK